MSGVFVTGHVRSGTSMVAGLFRAHGVFFGDCGGPVSGNAKGRIENVWLKRTMHAERWPRWPNSWCDRLRKEGWDGAVPWGAKLMPKWWPKMRETNPTVVVCCYRPTEDILASCQTVGWARSEFTVRDRREAMEAIEDEHDHVVRVDTPRIVEGDYTQIFPALHALGIEFSEEAACEWVDPELWHHAEI